MTLDDYSHLTGRPTFPRPVNYASHQVGAMMILRRTAGAVGQLSVGVRVRFPATCISPEPGRLTKYRPAILRSSRQARTTARAEAFNKVSARKGAVPDAAPYGLFGEPFCRRGNAGPSEALQSTPGWPIYLKVVQIHPPPTPYCAVRRSANEEKS